MTLQQHIEAIRKMVFLAQSAMHEGSIALADARLDTAQEHCNEAIRQIVFNGESNEPG